jgi:hypothetical protein
MKSSKPLSFEFVQVADLPVEAWGEVLAEVIRKLETPVFSALESAKTGVSKRGSEGKSQIKTGSVISPIHLQENHTTRPVRTQTLEVSQ